MQFLPNEMALIPVPASVVAGMPTGGNPAPRSGIYVLLGLTLIGNVRARAAQLSATAQQAAADVSLAVQVIGIQLCVLPAADSTLPCGCLQARPEISAAHAATTHRCWSLWSAACMQSQGAASGRSGTRCQLVG